ncbi:hypothetical protein OM427_30850 [Halomonas sp. 18H]|nr:hypothetical protein [Halomonas sp. 18H]MCW4153899.1 hypothetical protein [Halomonas sp. 18H]
MGTMLFLVNLLVFSAFVCVRFFRLFRLNSYTRIFGELYVPIVLLMLYGYFAIPLLFQGGEKRFSYFSVKFGNIDIFISLFVMTMVSLFYIVGFDLSFKKTKKVSYGHDNDTIDSWKKMAAAALILFDIYLRFQQIIAGQYFDWMRTQQALENGGGVSPLWLLQDGLAPLLACMSYYFSRANRAWLGYLAILLFLLLLEGKREKIILALGAILVLKVIMDGRHFSIKQSLVPLSFLLLVSVFFLNAIMAARSSFRGNISYALENPVEFINTVAFDVVPRSFISMFSGAKSSQIEGANLNERLPSWAIAFSSEIRRYSEEGHLPFNFFWGEVSMAVPAVLWPGNKPSIEISTEIANFYNLWPPLSMLNSADMASTAFVNVFLYGGFIGAIIYGLVCGFVVGFTAKFLLNKLQFFGVVVFVGAVYYINITTNSFAGFLVGFRNLWVVIISIILFKHLVSNVFIKKVRL